MSLSRRWRILRHRVRAVLRKDVLDAELARELAFHCDLLEAENVADGMAGAEARNAARRMLGNTGLIEEQCRDQRRVGWLHDLWQDVRYAARLLRKNAGFTAVAVASLALGIGANTAILGVMQSVLFGSLHLPDAGRLVVVLTAPLGNPRQTSLAAVPDYFAWKEQSRSFQAIGASLNDQKDLGSEENGRPAERVAGQGATPGMFAALGVQPMLGRVFTEEEDQIEHPAPVIVLSQRLWQRRYNGDTGILGKRVRLNSEALTVIGIMPADFRYPNESTEYWVPLALNRYQLQGSARYFLVTARLKPDATRAQAQAELEAVSAQLSREFPERNGGWGVRVEALREYWLGWAREPLLTLEAAVLLAMLITCANLATLLLARASARRPEFAMRAALGAHRGRLARQLLTESLLLALMGGAAGVLVAVFGLRALPHLSPPPAGMTLVGIRLNWELLAATALVSIVTGVAFGMVPALSGLRLESGVRDGRVRTGRHAAREALVMAQFATALILLAGSGLMVNSFLRLVGKERNFEPRGILTFEYRIPLQKYLKGLGSYRGMPVSEVTPPSLAMKRMYERLRALPGAESVAGISFPPVNSLVLPTLALAVDGKRPPLEEAVPRAVYSLVTPNFFRTLKTPLVRGRECSEGDTASAPWVAVVNETAARRFWPGEDPLGKRITLDAVAGERPREVVGVARDVPQRYISAEADAAVYVCYLQQPARYRGYLGNMFGQMTFLVRTPADPLSLMVAAQKAAAEVDPERALANIQTLEQYAGGRTRDRAYYAVALGVFAAMATLLAAIGVYGVMAYSVAQRTREIGIRMALGAGAGEIVRLIGLRALLLIGCGLAVGLAGSAALLRLLEAQLWEVRPTDPLTLASVTVLLAVVAVCACIGPARRAMRVDPVEALRSE